MQWAHQGSCIQELHNNLEVDCQIQSTLQLERESMSLRIQSRLFEQIHGEQWLQGRDLALGLTRV